MTESNTKITSGTKGKKISGFPNYNISKEGKIWNNKLNKFMKLFENKLKHRPTAQYYLRIALANKGVRKKFMVHRLVAKAYIPNPENKPFVNHKNGNKQDNRLENLEWMTNRENCIHASVNNLRATKLSNEQVREIRKIRNKTNQSIAMKYKVSRRYIGMIRKRERRFIVSD